MSRGLGRAVNKLSDRRPINLLNVMWSAGNDYNSVHKVHAQIVAHCGCVAFSESWLLMGRSLQAGAGGLQNVREWEFSKSILKKRLWAKVIGFNKILKLKRELNLDTWNVVLIDGPGVAAFLLPLIKDRPNLNIVVIFHSGYSLKSRQLKVLKGFLGKRKLKLAAVSESLATAVSSGIGHPVSTLRISYDPQEVMQSSMSRPEARKRLGGLPRDAIVFGAVGRLVESKGFELLIEAYAEAIESLGNVYLVIIGEGALRPVLERRIIDLGMSGKVLLPGYISGATAFYSAFNWTLIPSRNEGLGLVLQESLLARVPVVVSDLPVFREQLGDAGIYVPLGGKSGWVKFFQNCASKDASSVFEKQFSALSPYDRWAKYKEDCNLLISEI